MWSVSPSIEGNHGFVLSKSASFKYVTDTPRTPTINNIIHLYNHDPHLNENHNIASFIRIGRVVLVTRGSSPDFFVPSPTIGVILHKVIIQKMERSHPPDLDS
jgi:hypothetical protein